MARTRPQLPSLGLVSAEADDGAARGQFTRSAYDLIRNAILECRLLPGVALSEQALSQELGVSRAPVRDALRQLAAEHLVQVVPQRGTYVALLDPVRIRDAIFVREVIECRAAQLAAAAPLAQRKALLKLLQRQARASRAGDYTTHLQADEELHREILRLAGHPHAWPALRLARTGMNRVRHLAIETVGSHRIAVDQHRLIVDAIIQGNAVAASEHMRVHITAPLQFLQTIAERKPEYIAALGEKHALA
ncbi:MAG: hypothetical protein RL087_385 [Pseudomonadota bacterium]